VVLQSYIQFSVNDLLPAVFLTAPAKTICGQSVRTERIVRRRGKLVVRWRYMHVGAPDNRIIWFLIVEFVLTPRDEDMNPILGLGSHHLTKNSFITSWSRSATHFLKFFQISNIAANQELNTKDVIEIDRWLCRNPEPLALYLANKRGHHLTEKLPVGERKWFDNDLICGLLYPNVAERFGPKALRSLYIRPSRNDWSFSRPHRMFNTLLSLKMINRPLLTQSIIPFWTQILCNVRVYLSIAIWTPAQQRYL